MKSPLFARLAEEPHAGDGVEVTLTSEKTMQAIHIQSCIRRCFVNSMQKGFWEQMHENDEDLVLTSKLMLITSELGEALEVLRTKWDHEFIIDGGDPVRVERVNEKTQLPYLCEELCDAAIRIFDILGYLDERRQFLPHVNDPRDGRQSAEIMLAKMDINEGRTHKHGKQF